MIHITLSHTGTGRQQHRSTVAHNSSQSQGRTARLPLSKDTADLSLLTPELQQQFLSAVVPDNVWGRKAIRPSSAVTAMWLCSCCSKGRPHIWESTVANRTHGQGCPFCAGRQVCLCNSLASRRPDLAAEWSSEHNRGVGPDDVSVHSNKEGTWQCGEGHVWRTPILNRTRSSRATGCPQCWSQRRKQASRQQHPSISEGAPHLLADWDFQQNFRRGWTPENTSLRSNRWVHWLRHHECPAGQEHRWRATVYHRTFHKSDSPFLSGRRACACNSLEALRPDIACLLHPTKNESLTAAELTTGSGRVVWWQQGGFEWQQSVQLLCRQKVHSERHVLPSRRARLGLLAEAAALATDEANDSVFEQALGTP